MDTGAAPNLSELVTRLDELETWLEQLETDFDERPSTVDLAARVEEIANRVEQLEWSSEPEHHQEPLQQTTLVLEPSADTEPSTGAMPLASVDHDLRELQHVSDSPVEPTVDQPLAAATEQSPEHTVETPSGPPVGTSSDPLSDRLGVDAPAHRPVYDLAYVEERLAGRVLALVGGAALILGAIFFLSLAFSRGWIGPDLQVVLGLLGGLASLAVGGVLLVRGDRIVGHVLTAVGLAVVSLSFFAATTLYQLVPPTVGLAGTFAVAALTTAIAIRTRSQIVAALGLLALLGAPPILGAEADLLTLIYMVAALAGVAAISLWQTWVWLPSLAFLLSAPQLYQWIMSAPPVATGIVAVLVFWSLMAVAAGGDAFRERRPQLSLTSAPLLLGAGAFAVFLGFQLLPTAPAQAGFLVLLAALHAGLSGFFLARRGLLDPFGLLAAAYGVAIASMAVPLLFGAGMTAVIWTAEAAALAVLAGRRAHGPSLMAAIVLMAVAAIRIGYEAMTATAWASSQQDALVGPFDALTLALGFLLLAAAVFVASVPVRTVRYLVVSIAALACLPVIYVELDGLQTVIAWTTLSVVMASASGWLPRLPEHSVDWQLGPALEWLRPKQSLTADAALVPVVVAGMAWLLAFGATLMATLAIDGRPDLPFSDRAGLSALTLATGTLLMGLARGGSCRRLGIIVAGLIVGTAAAFQVPGVWLVVLWAALALGAFTLGRTDGRGRISYVLAATVALGLAAAGALAIAPPGRLIVEYAGSPPHPLLASEATLALCAVAIALALGARLHEAASWSDSALAAAGVVVLYVLSVGMVDVFAGQAYGLSWQERGRIEELGKEAQVSLSVLWTVVGVVVTGAGLVFQRTAWRVAGLAVLGLAAAKVFFIDLSSLDVAYRVVTLIVLGLLLVAIAFAWTRLKPLAPGAGEPVEPAPADPVELAPAPPVASQVRRSQR